MARKRHCPLPAQNALLHARGQLAQTFSQHRNERKLGATNCCRVLRKMFLSTEKRKIAKRFASNLSSRQLLCPRVEHNLGLRERVFSEIWESLCLRLLTKSKCKNLGKEKEKKEGFSFSYGCATLWRRGKGAPAVAPYVQSLPAGICQFRVLR